MAGLGILLAGLSGAGKGLGSSIEADRDAERRQELMREQSRLEEEKTLRIDEARRSATRAAGVQQGQEISAGAGLLQSQRNQSDADRINADNANVIGGSSMTADDAASLRNAPPEARKAYGLLGSTRQSDLEDRATAAENLGYLDAARETRGQLQTEVGNQRNQDIDKSTNRRLDLQETRQGQQDDYNRRREDRLDRMTESTLAFQKARAGKEDARADQMAEREMRSATSKALDGVNVQMKELQKEGADQMMPPERKAIIDSQIAELRAEGKRYRTALAGAGIPLPEQPGKTGWDSGSGDVYQGGKKIGTAKSESDARRMVSGGAPATGSAETVKNPVAEQPQVTEAPRVRSTAEIRGRIETRTLGRGKSGYQYQNPKTGEWVSTIEEASKGL